MAEINITPFTDVVLVLLIIFMIATPLIIGSGIKVNVPKAFTSKPDEDKFLTVSIDAQENLYLNEKKISLNELAALITESTRKGSKIMVKINGDKNIKYKTIIDVLSTMRNSGVVRYLLVAEKIRAEGGN